MRHLSLLDKCITEIDQSLRTVYAKAPTTERSNPAKDVKESDELTTDEKKQSAQLMRINHSGEIAAQGLYRGQALTATKDDVKLQMQRSAMEENDHLDWCENRLNELESHKSYFNPIWYWGSFSIGATAGLVGDKWSLGFVKETEDQVVRHLDAHLEKLSAKDLPSITILQKMKQDELRHGDIALKAGGAKLPWPIRKIWMPLTSKIMTKITSKI